ncbi:hypothetical protein BH11PSE8_BH11PSE8_06340 [soil metagenome]
MLKLVGAVLAELDLVPPGVPLGYHVNITSGESLAISAFVDRRRFFQVKASEYSDLRGQYDAYCRASQAHPALVPRPLGFVARDGWTIMVSEGVHHTPVHAADFRRERRGGGALMDDALAFFAAGQQRDGAPGPALCHQELFAALEQHFAPTPYVDLAARCLRGARALRADSLGRVPQHGDLVINNLAYSEGRLIVFDWEDYGKVELPGFDLFTLSLSMLSGDAGAIRAMTDPNTPDKRLLDFLQRACALQGLRVDLYRRLIPLYLLVFLYLKRLYGVSIQERIGALLVGAVDADPAARQPVRELEFVCAP